MPSDSKKQSTKGFSDGDDQALLDAIEAGEFQAAENLEERRAYWKQVAEHTANGKRIRISISIPERDLSRIKAKALRLGLPYQTLINAILHQVATGERKLED